MATGVNLTEAEPAKLLLALFTFQQGAFISAVREVPGGIIAYSDVTPIPMWNNAAWLPGSAEEFKAFIGSASADQSGKDRRPVIYISDQTASSGKSLDEAGFEKFDAEAWMVWTGAVPPAHSTAAREITDPKDLEAFIASFGMSFQTTGSGYARALRSGITSAISGALRTRHFALFTDDKIASVGTLISDGELGCIYNLGTPP